MTDYINRLIICGYTEAEAKNLCMEMILNLSIVDLECFILSKEKAYVD